MNISELAFQKETGESLRFALVILRRNVDDEVSPIYRRRSLRRPNGGERQLSLAGNRVRDFLGLSSENIKDTTAGVLFEHGGDQMIVRFPDSIVHG